MQQPNTHPSDGPSATDKLDDDHYPAYSMGRAAEILGVTQSFLRGLDATELLTPQRSPGGHRRYSRHQLHLAGRVRELLDSGNTLEAACRIITLEDQLADARRVNAELQDALDDRAPEG
ncbi:MerR family transcriptional regulator [Nocardia higoensis]|uniref:MerR family transcriptional regulator n=1 Tax=Nocardia higoensis TaxID=228599 RepID=UPI0002D56FA4|nr:MerR family transcriptional regulator [Nocardia higoensis]